MLQHLLDGARGRLPTKGEEGGEGRFTWRRYFAARVGNTSHLVRVHGVSLQSARWLSNHEFAPPSLLSPPFPIFFFHRREGGGERGKRGKRVRGRAGKGRGKAPIPPTCRCIQGDGVKQQDGSKMEMKNKQRDGGEKKVGKRRGETRDWKEAEERRRMEARARNKARRKKSMDLLFSPDPTSLPAALAVAVME